jgi:hypothetical protein
LPVSAFNRNRTTKDGLGLQCRECAHAANATWDAKHEQNRGARWRAANPDRVEAYNASRRA